MFGYSQEEIDDIANKKEQVRFKYNALIMQIGVADNLKIEACEYFVHGALRRLKYVNVCIDNIFELLPINQSTIYDENDIDKATIYLQCFYVNLSGIIDNLALALWLEKGLDCKEKDLENHKKIVFENTKFREYLSEEFKKYLDTNEFKEWKEYKKNFRDAIAHRIPVYIPPVINGKTKEPINPTLMCHSLYGNESYKKISADKCEPLYFHAQIIADFLSIEEFINEFIKEILIK